jgi:glycosyltransferase involved in cell wall biosynthesis
LTRGAKHCDHHYLSQARPLRIGVNALFLIPGGVGGTEIYLRELLAALARRPRGHQFFVFMNRETGEDLVPSHPDFHAVQTGVAATSRPGRILYEQFRLPGEALSRRMDVMFHAGFTSSVFPRCPSVTLIYDLQHHRHPEFFKAADLLAWRALVWASAKFSRHIVTLSEASQRDIHSVYGVPLDSITVAEPGADAELLALQRTGDEPMVLYVSTLHPHKNHERLLDAFAMFHARHPEYRLVLAGMHGFHHEAVRRRIAERGLDASVRITGWIPRAELLGLYASARIAVFPSLFEGFGIPVLEAMAARVPLIISGVSPMLETAGGTALVFPPQDTGALAAALEQFASDPALRLDYAQRAMERALFFTWERAADAVLDALERAGICNRTATVTNRRAD